MAGFFRYPGGKSKLKKRIASKIHDIIDGFAFIVPPFGTHAFGPFTVLLRPNGFFPGWLEHFRIDRPNPPFHDFDGANVHLEGFRLARQQMAALRRKPDARIVAQQIGNDAG